MGRSYSPDRKDHLRHAEIQAAEQACKAEAARAAEAEAQRRHEAAEQREREAREREAAAQASEREARAAADAQEAQAREREAEAQEARRLAEAARRKAEESRVAEEESRRRAEEARRNLEEGIEPEMVPTAEDIQRVKEAMLYDERKLHFAICGSAGSGKSSLVNALRGISDGHRARAQTGIVETTDRVGRYPDPSRDELRSRFVWYDIPGAGTLNIPGWQYFKNQGLYVYDFVVVLMDNRFSKIEIEILRNCQRNGIPTFIVRSKADQHIDNIVKARKALEEEEEEEEEEEGDKQGADADWSTVDPEAAGYTLLTPREEFIQKTRESVAKNLCEAGLPEMEVYIVSKDIVRKLMNAKSRWGTMINMAVPMPEAIDEKRLMKDMIRVVKEDRYKAQGLNGVVEVRE